MITHSKHKTKLISLIDLFFNELASVAADASSGLQICGPKPDSLIMEMCIT